MQVDRPAPDNTLNLAARAILWLQVLVLGIGALQFSFANALVQRPMLAAVTLALYTIVTVLSYVLPALRCQMTHQHAIAVVALLCCVTGLAAASGGTRSAAIELYAIALAVAALAFGRVWLITAISAAIVGLCYGLGVFTPGGDLRDPQVAAALFIGLMPGVAVSVILAVAIGQMHSAARRISDLASTDAMTGLLNLRAFEAILQQEHRKAERFGRPYTLVVVDVGDVTLVNETLGHDAGSQVIVAVAAAIARSIRGSDIAARLGGDEFIVLLSEADAAMGSVIAQRIRNNVHAGTIAVANRMIRASATLGCASFPEDHLYPKELMILADQRMQQDRELRRHPTSE